MAEGLRLMAVHAHPDDESSKGAGTMARYRAAGVEVLVVTCTGGERGDVLNPALQADPEVAADLPAVRRRELARAVEILGVDHIWLGFIDSGLPEGDPLPPLPEGCFAALPLDVVTAPLVREIRRFRPHVITTYDETGGYPHPDHVRCHEISVAAFEAAGDAERYPAAGPPWRPLKLYYDRSLSRSRMQALHDAVVADGGSSTYEEWLERRPRRSEPPVTTRIEVGDYLEIRDRALLAHATQIDPEGWFFQVPRELQRRVWPWEDYHLARSLVATTAVEDDLFAGVRPGVEV